LRQWELWVLPVPAAELLVWQVALRKLAAQQQGLLEKALELPAVESQLSGQVQALSWRAAPQAHALVASPPQAPDVPVARDAHEQERQAFAVQPWRQLPWLRGRLRQLPQHPRHPSSDGELFRQLRR
jgi:hypothetical protein